MQWQSSARSLVVLACSVTIQNVDDRDEKKPFAFAARVVFAGGRRQPGNTARVSYECENTLQAAAADASPRKLQFGGRRTFRRPLLPDNRSSLASSVLLLVGGRVRLRKLQDDNVFCPLLAQPSRSVAAFVVADLYAQPSSSREAARRNAARAASHDATFADSRVRTRI